MLNTNVRIIMIVTLTILITYLHYAVLEKFSPQVVLEELYYLPLLYGALRFGLKGAIATWVFVSAAYLPFFSPEWAGSFPQVVDRVLHLVVTGVFASVAGILAAREKKHRAQVERDRYLAGIGQVVTVIVHDLKNPLISIMGFARRIHEGKGDTAQAALTITESAQQMQRIVTDVLDFGKPMQLDLKEDDIRQVIRRAGESCRTKAEEAGVTLTVQLPEEQIPMVMDSFTVERALVNLIDNAVDASSRGGNVLISLTSGKNELVVTIKDRGAGMDPEALANLFMPFYTTKNGGTGLGIPIAKKIFEEHSGMLHITSKKGVGTEATVRLPWSNRQTAVRSR